jgi:tetratricopeptide (TPR) repeat protein
MYKMGVRHCPRWLCRIIQGAVFSWLVLGVSLTGYTSAEVKPPLKQLIANGNALAKEGKYEAAARAYRQAWGLYNSSDAAYNLAVIYDHELGFKAKAVHYYKRFLTLEPEAAEARQVKEWLISAQQQIKAQEAGQPVAQKKVSLALAKFMESAGDELNRQAKEYLAQGEYEAAIGAFRRALIVNQSAAACYNLALLYDYDLNYKAKAIYYYQRYIGMVGESSDTSQVAVRLEQVQQELLQEQGLLFKPKVYKLRTIGGENG